MKKHDSHELRVSVDIGCRSHTVAIGVSSGELLDEFSISHEPEGFREFFSRIEKQERRFGCPVAIAMEGFNGHARPLDSLVRARDYRLFNSNNLKPAGSVLKGGDGHWPGFMTEEMCHLAFCRDT